MPQTTEFAFVLAYMDPGAGNMLLQLLAGGLAGVALAWRLIFHRVRCLFRRRDRR